METRKKQVVIDIMDDGTVMIETVGFKGKACLEETEWLKKAVGKTVERRLTASYYDPTSKQKRYSPLCG